MKKVTVFGAIFAIIILGIYAAEAYSLYQLIAANGNMQFGLDLALKNFFHNYPWWWTLCTIGGIVCGLLAPILYFCQSVHSIELAYSAFGLDALLFVLNLAFRQRLQFTTVNVFLYGVIVALLTVAFAGYLSTRKETTYTSNSGWRFLGSR